jgi:hypothetical protein
MIDAQTNPLLFADFIARSPDILLIIAARLPYRGPLYKRTQRTRVLNFGRCAFSDINFALQ